MSAMMNSKLNLHTLCNLYQTPSKIYIQPCSIPEEALTINRQNGKVTLNQMFSIDFLPYNAISSIIQGIIGIKHLNGNSYLIVINGSTCVGDIAGHQIFQVDQTRMIPIDANSSEKKNAKNNHLTGEHDWETTHVKMIESVLQTPSFYFSHTYDLTNSLQRNYNIAQIVKQAAPQCESSGYLYYDKRFLWNGHLMNDFNNCDADLSKYILPLILGYFSINQNALGAGLGWTLISRRSVHRAGTRFNCRGIDEDGNVANFVETEQILERKDDGISSFVQIRGSIPLVWFQRPNYKWKPEIQIPQVDQDTPMRKHYEQLRSIYGNLSVVCLIDHRGHEAELAHEFRQRMDKIQGQSFPEDYIPFHHFDFHKECSKMRWHRLSILIEQLERDIESHGFFAIRDNNVLRRQTGVMRSNCIDSLDRTNVVQSMIAQSVLQLQFDLFGGNIKSLTLANYPVFIERFKNVWADNADALSIQYAGTPALKTDFTRTGQRTHSGMLKDGVNSLTRYVANNFLDSYRQDAINLFLGHYEGHMYAMYRPLDLTYLPVTIMMLTFVALYFYLRW